MPRPSIIVGRNGEWRTARDPAERSIADTI
jgi:hypothetical protein